MLEQGADGQGDGGMAVRHAETPELAQEALLDAVILIFKAQVTVCAFHLRCLAHMSKSVDCALSIVQCHTLGHGLVLYFPCARPATTAISYDAEPVPILVKVEVAFREQTAGHNALLLLVSLSHELLEARLRNAFLDVHARQAEVRPRSLACIV